MLIPHVLVELANLGKSRRPSGAPTARAERVMPDAASATRQLESVLARPVAEVDLPALREVQRAALWAAHAALEGSDLDCATLNSLAQGSVARAELVASDDGTFSRRLVWEDRSLAANLARRLIDELAGLDRNRLRCCARAECDLIFYDTTRSRTQQWHAEDPCGWRERQRRHRAGSGA